MKILYGLLMASACMAQLQVGVGSAVITPDLDKHGPVYMAGFGQNRVATGVHDPLYARCMALQVARQPLVLCGVDSIGLFLDDVEKIRARITGKAVIAALHDHEAPDTMGLWGPAQGKSGIQEAYNQFVIDGTVEAARKAIASMKAARVKLARTQDAELDTFIHDTRPPVRHDSELVMLSAEDLNGKPIGTLINWANHPETLGSKNTLITADYSGYLRQHLEAELGGTAVFINGAVGGMQSPLGAKLDQPENSFERAEWIGRRVAAMAAKAVQQAGKVEIDGLSFRETTLDIPAANPGFQMAAQADLYRGRKKLNANGTTATLVGYIKLSGKNAPLLEIAMIPGEMYPELSVGGIERYAGADYPDAPLEPAIKQQMKAPFKMLFGLANDEIGYIIPKAEWDQTAPWLNNNAKRWYGEVNSVGAEAGPLINQAFAELVKGQ
ncbi:MAG: neutral/alkaline non-lysosomal ceramidase N-terminal domain-containing protein [Acidobacteriia bacterium]|nr:neutral/alkaline non-lysosomal ceramidase N-terminal domain-containing protein [Terriglobia bacterium]